MSKFKYWGPKAMLFLVLVLIPLVHGMQYTHTTELLKHHSNFLGVAGYSNLYNITAGVGLPNVARALLEVVHLTGWFLLAIAVVDAIAIARMTWQQDLWSGFTLLVFTPIWVYGVFCMASIIGGPKIQALVIVAFTYVGVALELRWGGRRHTTNDQATSPAAPVLDW